MCTQIAGDIVVWRIGEIRDVARETRATSRSVCQKRDECE